jgi:hypothetical protein
MRTSKKVEAIKAWMRLLQNRATTLDQIMEAEAAMLDLKVTQADVLAVAAMSDPKVAEHIKSTRWQQ